ncbi:signal peptidase I, partial [bacterium]|nr:signal peptidase I [bacterium]
REDIIVFKDPAASSSSSPSFLTKRVIAVPGDKIKIENGKLYLNGKPKEEPYIAEKMVYYLKTLTISKNHIFVLGDNRNNSSDSSMWGALPIKNIIGKAIYVYWPRDKIRAIK